MIQNKRWKMDVGLSDQIITLHVPSALDANLNSYYMIGKTKKQEDLEHLRRFITQQEICGFVSHLWYSSLRAKYPFVFIQLMKKYRNTNKNPKAIEFDDRNLRDAIIWGNKLLVRLNKYLLEP